MCALLSAKNRHGRNCVVFYCTLCVKSRCMSHGWTNRGIIAHHLAVVFQFFSNVLYSFFSFRGKKAENLAYFATIMR